MKKMMKIAVAVSLFLLPCSFALTGEISSNDVYDPMRPVMVSLCESDFDAAQDELDTLAFYQRESWTRVKLMQLYVATMIEDDEKIDELLEDIEKSEKFLEMQAYFHLECWHRIKLLQLYTATLYKDDARIDEVLREVGEYIRDYKIQHL